MIAYASRTCTERERVMGSTEGELLALVFAITKFHRFIAGAPFTVVVDNVALQYLHSAKSTNNKLARWAIRLSQYDFRVKYRPGVTHGNVDGLSRSAQQANLSDAAITIDALHALPSSPALSDSSDDDDPHIYTLMPAHATTLPPDSMLLGPRQALLEAAPCQACRQLIKAESSSLVCDLCNAAYHLRCTTFRQTPTTAWFCPPCAS